MSYISKKFALSRGRRDHRDHRALPCLFWPYVRRPPGHLASSGLKSTADSLVQSSGLEALAWIGKVGTWQYAMAIGGVLLALAAFGKFFERLADVKGGLQ